MPSKRSFIRRVATLTVGGLVASGTATANSRSRSNYDASVVADAETTVTATVDRSVLDVVGVPEPARSILADIRTRSATVTLEDIDAASGSVAVDGEDVVGGCLTLTGSFDPQAVSGELRDHELAFREVDDNAGYGDTGRRFLATDDAYAVEPGRETIRIGYGRDGEDALAHVEASGGSRRQSGAAGYGSLPSVLSGDAVAYADLGPATRRASLAELEDAPASLRQVLEVASAVGVAVTAGEGGTALRYGIHANPSRLSRETLETLLSEATTGEHSLERGRVSRNGWTAVVDAAVGTGALWPVHERLVGCVPTDR